MCIRQIVVILLVAILAGNAHASRFQLSVPGSWSPSQSQIEEAMEKFRYESLELARKRDRDLFPWAKYRTQFAGVWEYQKQYIHFITICLDLWEHANYWKEWWVSLNEEFPCYFQGTYDVETKSIRLHTN